MVHNISISTPANTAYAKRKKSHWQLELGIVEELFIYFPPGCMAYNKLQMYYHGALVFPKARGYFRGNNALFSFHHVYYPLFSEPYELVCITWNTSMLYSHSVDIYATVTPYQRFLE